MDDLAARIYTQLELASTMKAATLERTHSSKPESSAPQISDAPHLAFKRDYEAALTPDQRSSVIRRGLDTLHAIRYSRRSVDKSTLEGRMAVARDQRPASIVAKAYGISERTVYYWRAELKRSDRRAS